MVARNIQYTLHQVRVVLVPPEQPTVTGNIDSGNGIRTLTFRYGNVFIAAEKDGGRRWRRVYIHNAAFTQVLTVLAWKLARGFVLDVIVEGVNG